MWMDTDDWWYKFARCGRFASALQVCIALRSLRADGDDATSLFCASKLFSWASFWDKRTDLRTCFCRYAVLGMKMRSFIELQGNNGAWTLSKNTLEFTISILNSHIVSHAVLSWDEVLCTSGGKRQMAEQNFLKWEGLSKGDCYRSQRAS